MVPNGLLPNVAAGVTRRLDAERWAVAEERTAELIARIQPTPASEARRRAVADCVQRLIMGSLSCQVFTFGSVPLKTYLPDGDIDVTALSNSGELKDTWAITVRDALEHEEKSENAEFRVREVQYIQAEVKIIKCLVENIVVDISFNQVGGLCTLCFLEEMDNLINQNHLFKRSIVLIKAWCYYESRILGAHHGLISTYALETLVLYIFHVFNNSFAGPLEVLYRFLEFFSNFDWEKFCVSLRGPVPISSLPDMAAEPPRGDDGALLLSRSFLDTFSTIYAVTPPSAQENHVQLFVSKHFNVVDPLRTNNNLGRSVSKGVHGNHIKKSSQDEQVSSVNASPNPSVSVSDLSSVSSSHYEDICFATNEELASVTEASDMLHKRSQEEHDLADLMASTKLHSFNGQVPLPVQMPSRHSVAPSPVMASAGNSQGNLAEIFPPNFPFIRAPWLPNMQFVHGFVPPPMTHYAASPAFAPNSEDGNESERAVTTDMNCDDGTSWHENGAGLSGNFNQERIDPQMFNFDGKEHSPSLHDVPGAPLQWHLKSGIEDSGAIRENYANMFHNQSSGGVSTSASSLSRCTGSVSSQASSRRKTLPDNSSDESTGKFLTSSRDKWGKIPAVVAPSSSSCSNTKTSWQFENTTECIPSDHDPLQVSRHNPVFAPILIGSPQQGQDDNSGLTFVPTGPLVPYVVYQFIPGNTDGSVSQFERKEGMDQFPVNMSFGNFGSHDDADELDVNITSTASSSVIADHDGKSDILSSDITSHRQKLQYGRLCQNTRPPASMNLPGHFPVDGPGRPPAPNLNWAQLMGPGQQVVPVMPLQPASERASGVFQRYGEDAPGYRGGTGTYLPSPKVPFRDRQSSSRNHRGSYNSDRFYHSDKDGCWVNSKQRNVGRSYGRSPSEKSGTRLDRQTSDESKNDRQSQSYRNDSYRREAGGPSLVHSHSFGSTNPTRNPGNMTYGVYPQPSAASNGASALSGSPMQPVIMCSYDQGQGVNYGVSGEPIEFGSLGAIPMDGSESSDIQRPTHEVEANGFYEQRHAPYRGGSSRSSPDQPSSPHLRRS